MFEESRHPEIGGGDRLQIQSVARADGAELRLSGDLTVATLERFVDRLRDAETSDVELLVIDLRELRFLVSVALGALVAADQRSRGVGRRLMLISKTRTPMAERTSIMKTRSSRPSCLAPSPAGGSRLARSVRLVRLDLAECG